MRFWISLKEKIDNANIFQLYREISETSNCRFCGSVNNIKWGYRKNQNIKTPRFKCKDCGQTFVVDEGFAKMRFDPKVISLALDLELGNNKWLNLIKASDKRQHVKL